MVRSLPAERTPIAGIAAVFGFRLSLTVINAVLLISPGGGGFKPVVGSQPEKGEASMADRLGAYRHVVLFKFKDEVAAETVTRIEAAFREFCAKLPFVADFEWGLNSSPENLNEGFTHCFLVTFAGPEGRDAYLPHPLHVEFVTTLLDPALEKALVVDYQARE
jgi:hypothetical protein